MKTAEVALARRSGGGSGGWGGLSLWDGRSGDGNSSDKGEEDRSELHGARLIRLKAVAVGCLPRRCKVVEVSEVVRSRVQVY